MRNKDAIELLLKNNSWPRILSKKPLFANMCDQWDNFDVKDWIEILRSQPHLANKCSIWENFDGSDWHNLLYYQPLFIDKCNIEKLRAATWVILLEKYPQLAGKCDKWDEITGEYWSRLLKEQPQFADTCDWNKLDAAEWLQLLEVQPQFADKCDKWEQFTDKAWGKLLSKQPQFADRCDWNKVKKCDWSELNSGQWSLLLQKYPQFADKCDKWDKFDALDWVELLTDQSQFAIQCNKWDEIYENSEVYDDGNYWELLLGRQPQFADKCNWNKLDASDQSSILQCQPQLEHKCNKWDEFDAWDWANLLNDQPQFANKCNKWDEFDGENWSQLLKEQPQFADRCDWSKLDASDWLELLKVQPQFADKCDEWDEFDAWSWRCLLQKQPQFAAKCPFGSFNGDSWVDLLTVLPDFINNCYLDLLTGENWCSILKAQPQLADKCQWEKLNGALWVELLNKHPQLAEKCDWDKLNGVMWATLLSTHPEFADKCNWDKLDGDGSNWRFLLNKQPQFADKCDWDNQDVITDERTLKEYKDVLLAFLTDFTKLESDKFDTLSIIRAKNYHEYKLVIDDTAISRCFKQYTKKTQEKEISSGNELDKSCLWKIRTDLLNNVEKLKADGDSHFYITLSNCKSVIECTSCHGAGTATCSHCDGSKVTTCTACNGVGEYEMFETVNCPRCSHLSNPGWIGSRVCDLCGSKKHYASAIYYKGQKYEQRVQDSWDILHGNGGSGRLKRYYMKKCDSCDGSGECACDKCEGTGSILCTICDGSEKLEAGWKIEQKLIEHKKSTTRVWIEQLPLELENIFYKTQSSPDIRSMQLFKEYDNSGKVDLTNDDNVQVKGFRKKGTIQLTDTIETCRKNLFADESDYLVRGERIELYRKPVFTKVLFQYLNQTYCVWFDCNDKKLIYDFTHDGFTSAWNRAKTRLMQNLGPNQKEFSAGVNYLGIVPGNLSDDEKSTIPNECHSHIFNPNTKTSKKRENDSSPSNEAHNTAKKEDKGSTFIDQTFTSKNPVVQEQKINDNIGSENITKDSKSRNIYAALAIFLPGIHNLYAGYIARGIIQLLIAVCSLGLGLAFTWPWALFEASYIKTDAKKNLMRPGWLQWIPRSILIIAIIIMVAAIIHDKIKSTEADSTTTEIKESSQNSVVEERHKEPVETTKQTSVEGRHKETVEATEQTSIDEQRKEPVEATEQTSVEERINDYTAPLKLDTEEHENISFSESSLFNEIKEKITLKKILIVFVIFAVIGIIMGCCNVIYLFSGTVDIIISAFLSLGTVLTWYFWRDNAINDTEAYCLLGIIGTVFLILSLFTTPGKYWAILFVFPGKVLLSFLGIISVLLVFKSCLECFKEGRKKGGKVFLELLVHAGILFGTGKLICMTTREYKK